MKSCFLTVGPRPRLAKIPGSAHDFALGTISTAQYRVCGIPVKGLWASSLRMRPLTCHLSSLCIHEMSFFGSFL